MVFPRLATFDSWFDGNMSLARRLVDLFERTKDFSLTSYPGQEAFYEEYLTRYDEYATELEEISGDLSVPNKAIVANVRSALYVLASQGFLTLAHLLMGYTQIFYLVDRARGLTPTDKLIAEIDMSTTVDEIIDRLNDFAERNPRVVPFTSSDGCFRF